MRESFHRPRQVGVGAVVVADEASNQRHDHVGVDAEELLHREAWRRGQFHKHQVAARLEHAAHLAQPPLQVLEVACTIGDGDGVEGGGVEGEGGAVVLLKTDDRLHACVVDLLPAYFHHPLADVDADDALGVEASGGKDGEVAGARGYIEDGLRGKGLQGLYGLAAPSTVDAEGQRVVEQVVGRCDVVEHRFDLFALGSGHGHGSGSSWGTTRFSNSYMSKLDNGWKMPILFDVACLNGRFVDFTGFGESWMRAGSLEKPAGLVAYVGATTSMAWVPPIHVQAEINKNLIVNEAYKTVGGLYMNGIMKGLELYTTAAKGDGVQILEQWHLFGDSTLQVRFKAPEEVKAQPNIGRTNGDSRTVKIDIVDKKGKPVSNARVTLYTKGVKNVRIGYTNSEGQAAITMPSNVDSGFMTVTGADINPIVDQPVKF